ncbi:MAG: hypothetical protein VYD67_07835, partial [Actinomycetota bacterium]|nr:hypothetical protein [Actinomycetota bacterium]
MFRRLLQVGLTASLVVLSVVVAARAAEPSVRPVLYPAPPAVAEVRQAALPTTTSTTTTTTTTTTTASTTSTTSTTTSEAPITTTTTEAPPTSESPA